MLGLMQDFPLTIPRLLSRLEGDIHRYTFSDMAGRSRQLTKDDPMVPNINARAVACLISDARLEFINCGHMLILTQAPRLSRVVREFVVA